MSGRLPARDIAILLFVAALWGSNNALLKVATNHEPPLLAAAVRFALQALMLLPFCRLAPAQVRPMLLVALLAGPLHFGLLYSGFATAREMSPMVVILQLWIPIAALLSVAVLGERVTARQMGGIAVALGGIAVMTADPTMFSQVKAIAMILGAATFWAASAVFTRKVGGLPVLPMQFRIALMTVPFMAAASAAVEQRSLASVAGAPWPFWAATATTAITSGIIGNGLMYRMVRKHPVGLTTPWLLATPLFSVLAGVLFLGEHFTARMAAGTAITIAGLLWLTLAQRQPRS